MNWNDIKKKKPLAYKSGGWDGLKSDKVLVCTLTGKYYVAEMYEGVLDGTKYCDFYDERDFEIKNVRYWHEITNPY